jgi:AcrR family transcriptional regulator
MGHRTYSHPKFLPLLRSFHLGNDIFSKMDACNEMLDHHAITLPRCPCLAEPALSNVVLDRKLSHFKKPGSDMTAATTADAKTKAKVAGKARRSRGRPQLRPDEETRVVILNAARAEFVVTGFAAASMENVARRAGVSSKTLYRFFPNKAALFEGMITNRLERFVSVVQLSACDDDDVETALSKALFACGEFLLSTEVMALQRMIVAESDRFPELAETFYKKAMQRTVATLAAWLKKQQQCGLRALANADVAAGMLLGMLAFEPQRAVLFGHKAPLTRRAMKGRARICAALFLRGNQAA